MQLGQYQIQIFVSVALILGAALIALICDYLKGHNEKLRELAVELKTRNEESAKALQILAGPLRNERSPLQSPPIDPPDSFLFPFSHATEPELEHDLSRAEAPAPAVRDSLRPEPGNPAPRERMSPETMIAIVRGAIKTSAKIPTPPQKFSSPAGSPTPAVLPAGVLQRVMDAASARDSSPASSAPLEQDRVRKDWNALLAARSQRTSKPRKAAGETPMAARPGVLGAVVSATVPPEAVPGVLPSGLQNALVWKRWLDSGRKISGLVVSISVTSSTRAETALDYPAAVRSAIVSLLEPGEFAAPTGTREFVVISPRARGAAALRRLSRISQLLWDVQLGSLGRFDLQYVWDGLEVRDETVKDALEAAQERMQQTRRSRHLETLSARRGSSFSLREAV
jgi:hypothetical protein